MNEFTQAAIWMIVLFIFSICSIGFVIWKLRSIKSNKPQKFNNPYAQKAFKLLLAGGLPILVMLLLGALSAFSEPWSGLVIIPIIFLLSSICWGLSLILFLIGYFKY